MLDVGAERLVVLLPDPLAQVHLRTDAHREAELVINRVLAEPRLQRTLDDLCKTLYFVSLKVYCDIYVVLNDY